MDSIITENVVWGLVLRYFKVHVLYFKSVNKMVTSIFIDFVS